MSKLPLPSHVQTKYLAADKKLDPAQIAAVQARAVKHKLDDPMAPGRLAQIADTFETHQVHVARLTQQRHRIVERTR